MTRKGRPFIWTESHQKTFDTIKQQLAKAPVLSLPDGIGRYTLYSDTSKTHAGSALWQMQKGRNRLIGYASKSLPKACANYGITELEMTGLMVNMENWKFYLGKILMLQLIIEQSHTSCNPKNYPLQIGSLEFCRDWQDSTSTFTM